MAINIDGKLPVLLKQMQVLDDLPRKLPIEGFLKNIAAKILPYSVYVDKWPAFNVIVTKPKDEMVHKLPAYRLGIYSHDEKPLTKMLCQPGFLPTTVPIRVFGLPIDLVPAMEKVTDYLGHHKLKLIDRNDPRYYCSSTKDAAPAMMKGVQQLDQTLSKDFYCSEIDPDKHGEYIALLWTYWKDLYETEQECIEITKYLMRQDLTIGVYTKSEDKLVSWFISNLDRSNMFGHTLPEYRKRNVLTWAMGKLAIKRFQEDGVFWGYVAESNPRMTEMVVRLHGMMHKEKVYHCVIRPKLSAL